MALKRGTGSLLRKLHIFPVRREDYESITGWQAYSVQFFATRWIEDMPVADKLIEI